MARLMTRRAALAAFGALAAGSVLGVGYVIRSIFESPTPGFRLTNGPGDGAMMGVGPVDMGIYMDMFRRHNQINRVVEEIPGGLSTTELNPPDLAAQLRAHGSARTPILSREAQELSQAAQKDCFTRRYRRVAPARAADVDSNWRSRPIPADMPAP